MFLPLTFIAFRMYRTTWRAHKEKGPLPTAHQRMTQKIHSSLFSRSSQETDWKMLRRLCLLLYSFATAQNICIFQQDECSY